MTYVGERLIGRLIFAVAVANAAVGCGKGYTSVGSPDSSVAPPALVLTSINPTSAALGGGDIITLSGSGFGSDLQVAVDHQACTTLVVASSVSAQCTAPAHIAATVGLVATSGSQTASLANSLTYTNVVPAPAVTAVAPAAGPSNLTSDITITGTSFQANATVDVGGSACTGVIVHSATNITCTTPAKAAGAVAITVTNTDLQSGNLAAAFTYYDPKYSDLVAGVLQNCIVCHGGQSGLFVDQYASITDPTFLTPSDPTNSLIYRRMTGIGGFMPPGGALSDADIQKVKDWITVGAPNN